MMGRRGDDRTKETQEYLIARSERRQFKSTLWQVRTGLYVQWLANPTPFRIRDYQRTPKTELLPRGCAVKPGKFNAGFLERRNLDDQQLHVRADPVTEPRPYWRQDRRGNWLVYPDVFRQIHVFQGPTEIERSFVDAVRAWLANRGLLIARANRPNVIERNNADPELETIGEGDFPRGEWMHVFRFDEHLFQELVEHLEA